MNRLSYLVRRVAFGVPVVVFGLTVSFLVLYWGPLDPVTAILGKNAAPADVRRLRIALGYLTPAGEPVPLWRQYLATMADLFALEFGDSWVIQRNTPVTTVIAGRLPATLWLGWWSVVIALVLGIPIGLLAGLKANTWGDYLASGGGIVWRAMPNFWLAVIVAGSLSAGGVLSWYRGFLVETDVVGTPDAVSQLVSLADPFGTMPLLGAVLVPVPNVGNVVVAFKWILPAALVLGSASMGNEIRIGRTAMLENLNAKYVETAKAKGLSSRRVVVKHIGRNAVIPLLPVIMGEFYLLVGGAVLVERVFAINGLGNLFLRAVLNADIPVVMALVFVFVVIQVLFNITQDLLYTFIDPRISLDETGD
jgi:peptide/nickel transport system permease protein